MRARAARLVAVGVALAVAGCTGGVPEPTTPTASAEPPRFTVATTGPILTTDPAVAVADTDTLLAGSLYQRLMLVIPSTGELKPDAATDCLFASPTVYECTLNKGLLFHNGNELTSSDVKFSLQRALRLDVTGTSVGLLSSLKRIDTPDPLTVRFELAYSDTQFGFALATLAASIVDEQTYDPDAALSLEDTPVGSGPFLVDALSEESVDLDKFADYLGALSAIQSRMRLSLLADSVAAEAAIAEGTADLVWRSLDDPALARLSAEIDGSPEQRTATGFTRWDLVGTRVTRLIWNPASRLRADATLRSGVALALQSDRTLSSIVPVGVDGSVRSFEAGGRPKLPTIKGKRRILRLGYSPSAPGHSDLANLLRGRIEELDNISVRLVSDETADLILSDAPPWTNTALGWLQPYLTRPLPGSADKIAELERRVRTTTGDARQVALGELQQQAAADLTVLPVSQGEGILMVGRGVELVGPFPFGSGGQLGLWGIYRG